MKTSLHIALALLLVTSCTKDEVEVSGLNDNPFDPEYAGPDVFELVGTYTELVSVGGAQANQQVIEFKVKEELFLSPASYSVFAREVGENSSVFLNPTPPGSDHFKFYRTDEPAPGVQKCLELRLSNGGSYAGAETICATL